VQWALLEEVPGEQVRELLKLARRRSFSRGEVVFHRDDPADCLHLIAKGRFAVRVMTPLGHVVTLAVRGPGESFGEMALVGRMGQRTAEVSALESSETFAVYRDDFAQLRSRHPSVDSLLYTFLVSEVRMLNERLLESLYLPLEKRVCRRLLELAALYPGEDGVSAIRTTQETVAELAGGSRATINQILRDHQREGLIELERGQILILDQTGLIRRAR
jgi:CRP-like cAMP-binding protein